MTLSTVLYYGSTVFVANDSLIRIERDDSVIGHEEGNKIAVIDGICVCSIYGQPLGWIRHALEFKATRGTSSLAEYVRRVETIFQDEAEAGDYFGVHIVGLNQGARSPVYHVYKRPASRVITDPIDNGDPNKMGFLYNGMNEELNRAFPEIHRLWYRVEFDDPSIMRTVKGLYDFSGSSVGPQIGPGPIAPPYHGLIIRPTSHEYVDLTDIRGYPVTTIARGSSNNYDYAYALRNEVSNSTAAIVDPYPAQSSFVRDFYAQTIP